MSAKLIKVVGLLCTFALQNDINKLIMHTRKEQMEAFGRFLDILDELREKCPWDRKQTNESLRPNTIEETYELCDALMKDDKKDICKELGDVLLHVAFYAKIGSETGDFDIKDVCDCLCEKLIFRHPHVFGEVKAETAEKVTENWEQLKMRKRMVQNGFERSTSCFAFANQGIPHSGQGPQRGI